MKTKSAAIASQVKTAKPYFTEDKILEMARKNESFTVNWMYRNSWLMNRCNRLVKTGLLQLVKNNRGLAIFVPGKKTYD